MKISRTLTLYTSFALALGILAGIHLLFHVNSSGMLENERRVQHTLLVVQAIDAVEYLVSETQSGSRGYVITGDERYLESYRAALSQLEPAVSKLRQLAVENPQQQRRCDRLRQLISTHLQLREEINAERRTRGFAAAADLIETGQGKALKENILALLSDMNQEEEELLAQRSQKAESANTRFRLMSSAGGFISVALLIAVFYFLRQEIGLRSRAESESRDGRVLLQSILDNLGDGVVSANREGRFTVFNPAAEQILGRGASPVGPDQWTEHYGVYLPDGATPFPAEQLPLARALRGESVDRAEMRICRPEEVLASRWLSVTARPIYGAEGDLTGGVAVFANITETKQAEERIQHLNRELEGRVTELDVSNRELEAFSYSVSHDLRAPLRQIHGFTKVVVEKYGPQFDTQARHYLGRIEEGASQMGRLIDDLLNLARLGRRPLKREPTQLAALVEQVRTELEAEINGRKVEWKVQPLPPADCDPGLMKQVFVNLMGNSLKYTRPREQAVIEVGESAVNGEPAIFVRDNGVGFSMKYADKLFGVFQRLHRSEEFEGTGVGLATVQRIVHKHGGRIWAEGEEGKGATFSFTLGKQDTGESMERTVEEVAR